MLFQLIILIMLQTPPTYIIDFKPGMELTNWSVVDDVVMGGISDGSFYLNDDGQGVFSGQVSLENNGGFSSVRYKSKKQTLVSANKFVIRLKGDGKTFQFRVKPSKINWYAFVYNFETTGEWQTIEIPMKKMYPSFRGQKLNFPNYSGKQIAELGFLIANNKNENFTLEIDYISAE